MNLGRHGFQRNPVVSFLSGNLVCRVLAVFTHGSILVRSRGKPATILQFLHFDLTLTSGK